MSLDVHMHGRAIGSLSREGGRGYRFAYAPEVVREVGEGETLLSGSMPLRAEPYEHDSARHYFEGLLPEGARREAIEAELGLEPGDDFGLLAALGRDCPGAVVLLSAGERPPARRPEALTWLTDAELEDLLSRPAAFLEDGEADERFILPGKRHKLALVRDEATDRWALPGRGAPSTHIVKPGDGEMLDFAVNEVACTGALRHMGLPVAHAEFVEIAGVPCVVSKRFDRWGEGTSAERLHSESFRQALGNSEDRTRGEHGEIHRAAELLRSLGEKGAVETLFSAAYCDQILGNGDDGHSTNAALIHGEGGTLLAPFYDICSERIYKPEGDGEPGPLADQLVQVSPLACMVRLGIACRMEFKATMALAIHTHSQLCTSLNAVAERAQREGWHAPVIEEILLWLMERFKMLGEEIDGLRKYGGQIPWIDPLP